MYRRNFKVARAVVPSPIHGYSAYPAYSPRHPGVELAGCWAHARRGICEARYQEPRRAAILLQLIGQLYSWERPLRNISAGPVLQRIRWIMEIYERKVLPKSLLGEALSYARNQWAQLEKFVTPVTSESTTTAARTPSDPLRWARRTGSS